MINNNNSVFGVFTRLMDGWMDGLHSSSKLLKLLMRKKADEPATIGPFLGAMLLAEVANGTSRDASNFYLYSNKI